jgi:hypothetical protein
MKHTFFVIFSVSANIFFQTQKNKNSFFFNNDCPKTKSYTHRHTGSACKEISDATVTVLLLHL